MCDVRASVRVQCSCIAYLNVPRACVRACFDFLANARTVCGVHKGANVYVGFDLMCG